MTTVDAMTVADIEPVMDVEPPSRMTPIQLREELERPWARVRVARGPSSSGSRHDVVGFLISWHVADELHVLNVATHAAHRRRGVGRALMLESIAFAKEKRLRHVLLEVKRSNAAAIALYRSVGFFAMGIRSDYYPDGEDAVEMVLLLDPATGDVQPHADEVRLEGERS
jgi:ribosomal-protein-alanine N-acetyltransferase